MTTPQPHGAAAAGNRGGAVSGNSARRAPSGHYFCVVLDIETLRDDTAGCRDVLHFNNAGSSLPPRQVVDAMVDYLRAEERAGGYEIAAARADDLDRVYRATARYLHCEPTEIAVTTSAGDAWWRAFSSVPLLAGDRILVSTSEYQANAMGWLQAADRGVVVDVVPNDSEGDLDVHALADLLDERVKLVSITMVAMTNGGIHPVAEVGRVLRERESAAIYLVDACQAAGQLPLDVREIGCDFLSYTGRKFMRAPRGTGILFVRQGVHDRLGPTSFVDGRSATWAQPDTIEYAPDATRFEFGEYGYGATVGLGVATEYMLDVGIGAIAERISQLSNLLRFDLSAIPHVQLRDTGLRKSGIVTFQLHGRSAVDVQQALAGQGMNVSAIGVTMAQLDLAPRSIDAVVRASVHYYNTEEEIARFCSAVADL